MFKDTDTQETSIQLLSKKKGVFTEQEMYEEYMANYVNWTQDTKGINKSLLKPSFLGRNLNFQVKRRPAYVRPELRYKIQQESYHMYYIVGSEDVFSRSIPSSTHLSQGNNHRWNQLISKNEHLSSNIYQ